jgi:hypothetical protein
VGLALYSMFIRCAEEKVVVKVLRYHFLFYVVDVTCRHVKLFVADSVAYSHTISTVFLLAVLTRYKSSAYTSLSPLFSTVIIHNMGNTYVGIITLDNAAGLDKKNYKLVFGGQLLLDDNDKSNKGMNLLGLDEILPTTLWM